MELSQENAALQVVILRDGLLVGTEVFTSGAWKFGADRNADVRLEDPSIAPQHAVLYFRNGRVAIQDTGTRLGTYVNGARVTVCEIRASDEVVLGPFVIKARVLEQKAKAIALTPELAALLGTSPGAPPSNPFAGPAPGTEAADPFAAVPRSTVPSKRRAGSVGAATDLSGLFDDEPILPLLPEDEDETTRQLSPEVLHSLAAPLRHGGASPQATQPRPVVAPAQAPRPPAPPHLAPQFLSTLPGPGAVPTAQPGRGSRFTALRSRWTGGRPRSVPAPAARAAASTRRRAGLGDPRDGALGTGAQGRASG